MYELRIFKNMDTSLAITAAVLLLLMLVVSMYSDKHYTISTPRRCVNQAAICTHVMRSSKLIASLLVGQIVLHGSAVLHHMRRM
jgi:hypothetical protein